MDVSSLLCVLVASVVIRCPNIFTCIGFTPWRKWSSVDSLLGASGLFSGSLQPESPQAFTVGVLGNCLYSFKFPVFPDGLVVWLTARWKKRFCKNTDHMLCHPQDYSLIWGAGVSSSTKYTLCCDWFSLSVRSEEMTFSLYLQWVSWLFSIQTFTVCALTFWEVVASFVVY